MLSYFQLLEIPPDTPAHEVQRVYEDLMTLWEPSRYASDPLLQRKARRKIHEIQLAFEALQRYQTGRELKQKLSLEEFDEYTGSGVNPLETGEIMRVSPARRVVRARMKRRLFSKGTKTKDPFKPAGIATRTVRTIIETFEALFSPLILFLRVLFTVLARSKVIVVALILLYLVSKEVYMRTVDKDAQKQKQLQEQNRPLRALGRRLK